jgi:hypothetical protein
LVLALLTFTAGCSVLAPTPESYDSHYNYTVGVDANATLREVTVRVPLPQVAGAPAVNASVVAPNGTVEGGFEVSVVETRYGPMLELTTDEFVVEPRYYRVVEEGGLGRREEISRAEYDPDDPAHSVVDHRTVGVRVAVDAPYPLDTRAPVGTEPTFYAANAVRRAPATCSLPYDDATTCLAYNAPVYLSYDAPADASVDGVVAATGSNEWFAGGWTGNSYADRVQFVATGPQDGWLNASGHTEAGRGTYPTPER